MRKVVSPTKISKNRQKQQIVLAIFLFILVAGGVFFYIENGWNVFSSVFPGECDGMPYASEAKTALIKYGLPNQCPISVMKLQCDSSFFRLIDKLALDDPSYLELKEDLEMKGVKDPDILYIAFETGNVTEHISIFTMNGNKVPKGYCLEGDWSE